MVEAPHPQETPHLPEIAEMSWSEGSQRVSEKLSIVLKSGSVCEPEISLATSYKTGGETGLLGVAAVIEVKTGEISRKMIVAPDASEDRYQLAALGKENLGKPEVQILLFVTQLVKVVVDDMTINPEDPAALNAAMKIVKTEVEKGLERLRS
jgi:hypothetical protein